jgi:hypothetical protein
VNEFGKHQEVRSGSEVVSMLKKKLRASSDVLDFGFVSLETVGKSTLCCSIAAYYGFNINSFKRV